MEKEGVPRRGCPGGETGTKGQKGPLGEPAANKTRTGWNTSTRPTPASLCPCLARPQNGNPAVRTPTASPPFRKGCFPCHPEEEKWPPGGDCGGTTARRGLGEAGGGWNRGALRNGGRQACPRRCCLVPGGSARAAGCERDAKSRAAGRAWQVDSPPVPAPASLQKAGQLGGPALRPQEHGSPPASAGSVYGSSAQAEISAPLRSPCPLPSQWPRPPNLSPGQRCPLGDQETPQPASQSLGL